MPLLLAALATVGLAPNPANAGTASTPYYFFSQPGIVRTQVLADFEECRDLASAVRPIDRSDFAYAPGMAAAAATGFLQGLERGETRRNMAGAAFRKCMTIKGYQRHAMTKDEAAKLYVGDWAVERERMADLALEPAGDHQRLDP